MKLLTKFNRNYLLLFSITLIILSFSGYFILKMIILDNTKENLLAQEALIKKQIALTNKLPQLIPLFEVVQVSAPEVNYPRYKEESIFNEDEKENELFMEYSNIIQVNNAYYLIKIREASVESEDLVLSIAIVIFSLLLAIFIISYFITKRLNKTIWRIFETNLKEIERFDFKRMNEIQLYSSGIDEFDRLNLVITNLTDKLKNDFVALKEFTENASHEIQSPLAIASLNLEEILQQDLNEESFTTVVTAINAVKRLSALNQNLLLLTKIENNQFTANDFININKMIERKLEEFEPLYKAKNIHVTFESNHDFILKMNVHLAGIMLNNLLSNAINHNINNGSISISVSELQISICNTGASNELTDDTIFNRFAKGNSKSHGLGLAIVKQICNTHHLDIHYSIAENHCFSITQMNENL